MKQTEKQLEKQLGNVLLLRRFDYKQNDYSQIDLLINEQLGIETNLVFADEQNALDYTLISNINLKGIEYAYIEIYYVLDRFEEQIIITEVSVVFE
jgi:hypothetical protein